MKKLVFSTLVFVGTISCATRVHPPPANPVGAAGCGSPIECYERALQTLAEDRAYWAAQQASLPLVPTGSVVAFAGGEVPEGWLLCDGRSFDKSDPKYKRLFEVIGTTHGGDASPNFQIPDYRGLFLRGVDQGAGRDPDAVGRHAPGTNGSGNTGAAVGSVQDDMIRTHSHSTQGWRLEAEDGSGMQGAGFETNSNRNHPWSQKYGTSDTGGSETRPKNAYVNYIIKL